MNTKEFSQFSMFTVYTSNESEVDPEKLSTQAIMSQNGCVVWELIAYNHIKEKWYLLKYYSTQVWQKLES